MFSLSKSYRPNSYIYVATRILIGSNRFNQKCLISASYMSFNFYSNCYISYLSLHTWLDSNITLHPLFWRETTWHSQSCTCYANFLASNKRFAPAWCLLIVGQLGIQGKRSHSFKLLRSYVMQGRFCVLDPLILYLKNIHAFVLGSGNS